MKDVVTVAAWREFVEKERATGGPDAHLAVTVAHAETRADPAWVVCASIAPYVSTTGALISIISAEHWASAGREACATWLRNAWDGIAIRRDRRSVLSPERLADCVVGLAEWRIEKLSDLATEEDPEAVWRSVTAPRYVGRYMGLKLWECLRRVGALTVPVPDVRSRDAWSPRRTLDQLVVDVTGRPSDLEHAGNGREVLAHVNACAAWAASLLDERARSWWELEVLLCNARQALGARYPGRSQDSDVEHHRKVVGYLERGSAPLLDTDWFDLYGIRRRLFDPRCLGEVQGWEGVRRELADTWRNHGYFWCDTVYSYAATTDLAHPVRWEDV